MTHTLVRGRRGSLILLFGVATLLGALFGASAMCLP